jgi:hypothetical protein
MVVMVGAGREAGRPGTRHDMGLGTGAGKGRARLDSLPFSTHVLCAGDRLGCDESAVSCVTFSSPPLFISTTTSWLRLCVRRRVRDCPLNLYPKSLFVAIYHTPHNFDVRHFTSAARTHRVHLPTLSTPFSRSFSRCPSLPLRIRSHPNIGPNVRRRLLAVFNFNSPIVKVDKGPAAKGASPTYVYDESRGGYVCVCVCVSVYLCVSVSLRCCFPGLGLGLGHRAGCGPGGIARGAVVEGAARRSTAAARRARAAATEAGRRWGTPGRHGMQPRHPGHCAEPSGLTS